MTKRSRIVPAPIIGLALSHIAGTTLAVTTAWPTAIVVFAWLSSLLAFLVVRKRIHVNQGILLAWMMLAWAHAHLVFHPHSAEELSNQMERSREHLTLTGIVIAEPYQQNYPGQENEVTYIPIQVDATQRTTQWKTAKGRILVALNELPDDLEVVYGDRLKLSGPVRQKSGPSIGLTKSSYRMHVAADAIEVVDQGHGHPLLTHCFKARARLGDILEINLEKHPDEANILKALLLGYRSELAPELTQQFAQTGTLHLFAISGLHVGIAGLLVIIALKMFGVPRTYWILFLLPVLILFVATTGMKASAVRAGIMACVYWGAPFLRRQPNVLTAMALAAMVVLIISPQQIADPGFLFSFIIVAGMIMLIPPLTELFTTWTKPDDWAPDTPENQPGRLKKAGKWFGAYASVSTSAWLTSLPLTAYFFNMFSPVALIGNLFAAGFATFIVSCGMLSLLFGSLGIPLAGFFNFINLQAISLLLFLIGTLNDLPHAWQYIASPPLWVTIVYLAVLGWIASQRKLSWGTAAVILCACISWGSYLHIKDQKVTLDVFDVAPGQASYLKPAGTEGYLIDTGSAYHARTVIRALKAKGIDRLDGIILTHSDVSHLAAIPQILETFPVDTIMIPVKYGSSEKAAAIFDFIQESGTEVIELKQGDRGTLAGDIDYRIFNPDPSSTFGSADDLSLIIHLSHGPTAVLVTGGMGLRAEKALYESKQDPGATVLITPNTSSWNSLTPATINLVRPRTAIVAGSQYNMIDGRISRLREQQIDVFRVQEFGPVQLDFGTGETRFLNE